jgi:hypothetical protein
MKPRHTVITSLREVDCSKYESIVKHPHVLRLNNVDQLSFVDKVYRGAKHSRYDHSIFVYHFTYEITNHLLEKGCITAEDKTNTEIGAILHDLGHPPYSHASGSLLEALGKIRGESIDHKIKALEIIDDERKDKERRTLKQCIEDCGGNVDIVKSIVAKRNPLSQIISQNTLGSDKIGYFILDSNRTFYYSALPFMLDVFKDYYYDGKRLGLEDESKVPQVRVLQAGYQDMYLNVYFHPTVRYYERLFEKSLQTLMEKNQIPEKLLWNMEQSELDHVMRMNDETRKLFNKIQNEEMDQEFLSIDYDSLGRREFKDITDFYSNPLNLTKAEKRIAELSRCSIDQIACSLTVIPSRIIPEDVFVFSNKKSVFEKYPYYFKSLVEYAGKSTSIKLYKEPEIELDTEKCREIILDAVKS